MKRKGKGGSARHPAVAGPGGFYPEDPATLQGMVSDYLRQAELIVEGPVFGLISPHAGYVYSGPVAGWAYRQVQDRSYSTVIVLAPSHMISFPYASVMASGSYITPLGEIPIDEELTSRLIEGGGDPVQASDYGHMAKAPYPAEHSLEVQLPFLQVAIGDFKLVPVVIGVTDWNVCQALGRALAECTDEGVLIVASSDLSHFHGYDEAYRLDGEVIEKIRAMDAQGLAEGCRKRELEACGGAPISALMVAADLTGARQVEILRHKTSGDVSGGMRDQVVGYLAVSIGFAKEEGAGETDSYAEDKAEMAVEESESGSGLIFTGKEQEYLLSLARQAVSESLLDKPLPLSPSPGFRRGSKGGVLNEKRGIFVTLKKRGQLRGCIGNLSPSEPLGELVQQVACQSAFEDPRFPPLGEDELEHVHFEITVLGKMVEAKKVYNELVVGKHGLLIRQGFYQGLLLPQVAVELGWDKKRFLEGVCQKAGLPNNAWRKRDARVFLFTADCFGEA